MTGKAGLDDIDLEAGQLAGDLQLFAQVHGSAGALLAVAQRCVEYNDAVVFHNVVL
jgi:predicted ABC-class ATPase